MQNRSTIPTKNLQGFGHGGFPVRVSYHHGPDDDLASAGLLSAGLASPTASTIEDPESPTAEELRRRAIYENYRALADTSPDGGFGVYYGPSELIPGVEVLGVLTDNATTIVQIPESFDSRNPKLLLIPASSSRGVYGGILLSEWGLARGYVAVLCDKGCGTGFHNLSSHLAVRFDGSLTDIDDSDGFLFIAPDTPEQIASFKERHPHRYATKHAHSTLNVEAKWGEYVLESLEFAHVVLERLWPEDYRRDASRVIATGLSNGGGAALRAAEIDSFGRIHAVVVGEPNVTPIYEPSFRIQQGREAPLAAHSKTLLEYASLQNLFQLPASPGEVSRHRLRGLQMKGLWEGLIPEEAAQRALDTIRAAGILKEQEFLSSGHAAQGVYEGMCVALANCFGRYKVTDHLFGYSYAAVDPEMKTPCALSSQQQARLYAHSNGLVPTGGLQVINDLSVGGPAQSLHSISAGTSLADANLDGALKLYAATWGHDAITGKKVDGWLREVHNRVARGMDECRASAHLGGRPAFIVNGRCDSIIAPNHSSRSYLGANVIREGEKSRLRYFELEHAQHLDTLNALPGFRERYVPLLPYVFRCLTLMEEVLEGESALPPSQVVRTSPRRSGEHIGEEHIPPVSSLPKEEDQIVMRNGTLHIPE